MKSPVRCPVELGRVKYVNALLNGAVTVPRTLTGDLVTGYLGVLWAGSARRTYLPAQLRTVILGGYRKIQRIETP
jgi:hypothetical protein